MASSKGNGVRARTGLTSRSNRELAPCSYACPSVAKEGLRPESFRRFDVLTRSTRTFLSRWNRDRQVRLPIYIHVHLCPSVAKESSDQRSVLSVQSLPSLSVALRVSIFSKPSVFICVHLWLLHLCVLCRSAVDMLFFRRIFKNGELGARQPCRAPLYGGTFSSMRSSVIQTRHAAHTRGVSGARKLIPLPPQNLCAPITPPTRTLSVQVRR